MVILEFFSTISYNVFSVKKRNQINNMNFNFLKIVLIYFLK